MTIYEYLVEDHDNLKSILKRMEEGQTALFDKMKKALVSHARAEEKTLYAMMKEMGDEEARDHANEAYEEHHAADLLIEELEHMRRNDDRWIAKFKVLKENLEHHIEEEEDELFEGARKLFTDKDAVLIGTRFQELKAQYEKNLPTQAKISEEKPDRELRETLSESA